MSNLAPSILAGFKGRRSVYSLANESTISDERIEEILSEVMKNMPSGFNTQGTRMVVLLKEEHQKLWDIAHEIASASVPIEQFENLYRARIAGFRAAYGTVLFYEDPAVFKPLEVKMPIIKDKFPEWLDHASGMSQLAVWTLLEAEGLGCNLQHYNPMIDARISEQWKVPKEWKSKSQLVFGKPTGPPREKTSEPLSSRLFVYGK
ncbi:hypothetical protein N7509_004930 [Penicillium cosmopolitanum]|uniref:Nitroreductase domain-containing protein n=1 Tax=Penicillium cosmopolitanum TaxID=1131564 RepID=A0A9W9W1K4_9EURO|nr:uncharacterized protein N7509_004930 [Penicillium cosmopolitanum]KAJ5396817.1 hypothetical protein N7509_004930 [Penicillium cosmopolitanum]